MHHSLATSLTALFCVSVPVTILTAFALPFLPLGVAAVVGCFTCAMVLNKGGAE